MDNQTQGISQEGFPVLGASQPEQLPLLELENLTVSYQGSIERLQEEAKKLKQQIDDAVNNDAIYHQKAEAVKGVKNDADAAKIQILKQPHMIDLAVKLKDLRGEIKSKKYGLSDYALEYAKLSGANQIERDGVTYEIVTVAKLRKVQQ